MGMSFCTALWISSCVRPIAPIGVLAYLHRCQARPCGPSGPSHPRVWRAEKRGICRASNPLIRSVLVALCFPYGARSCWSSLACSVRFFHTLIICSTFHVMNWTKEHIYPVRGPFYMERLSHMPMVMGIHQLVGFNSQLW